MRNVVLWKQVFLGASLFLCGTSPVMATEVGDLVPDVRGNALQQDGRRVTCNYFRQSWTNCWSECPY